MTSPALNRPLRTLAQALADNRDAALVQLRHALDRAESLAADAAYDMPDARELSLMADVQNKLRAAVEALEIITGREASDDDAAVSAEEVRVADRGWHNSRVL